MELLHEMGDFSYMVLNRMRLVFLRFLISSLIYNGLAATIDPEVLSDQVKFCLEGGQILEKNSFNCYTPLERGPCKETEWFVQIGSTGFGKCAKQPCELPQVFYKDQCIDPSYSKFVCEEEGKGKSLHVNFQGESECRCNEDRTQGLGQSCDLYFTQGLCPRGKYIFPREAALDTGAVNVDCERGFFCSTANQCTEYNFFNRQLEELYNHLALRCRKDGVEGKCCPNKDFNNNLEAYYLDRFMRADGVDEGVCVDNPCPPGESMFVEEEKGEWKCYKADSSVYNCEDDLQLVDEMLSCCNSDCLTTFSFNTRRQRSCRRGYFWSNYRKRCIRAGRR